MNRSHSLPSILIFLFIVIVVIGLGWGVYQFTQYKIAGEGFSIQWISIRSLIMAGISPYDDRTTAEIQDTVKQENGFAPGPPARYTSPLYSGVIIFPFALIANETLAHTFWSIAQLIAIFMILLIGLKLTAWNPPWYIFLLFSLFTIFSYHVVIPLLDGGISIWAALFLLLSLLTISQNRNELAGILLALSVFQPQMTILAVVFTIIWAASQRKKIIILWFFITLIFLSVIGLLLVPDWILQYLRLLFNYQHNFPPGSPADLFKNISPGLGRQLGWLISGSTGLIVIVEWWRALKKDTRRFLWTICLTLVISQWIGIPTVPGNYSGLLLPLIVVSALLAERWPKGGNWSSVLIVLILFVWEWAIYYLDIFGQNPTMQLNLLIPLPMILLICLYWVRWWAGKPRRLLIEELKSGEPY